MVCFCRYSLATWKTAVFEILKKENYILYSHATIPETATTAMKKLSPYSFELVWAKETCLATIFKRLSFLFLFVLIIESQSQLLWTKDIVIVFVIILNSFDLLCLFVGFLSRYLVVLRNVKLPKKNLSWINPKIINLKFKQASRSFSKIVQIYWSILSFLLPFCWFY